MQRHIAIRVLVGLFGIDFLGCIELDPGFISESNREESDEKIDVVITRPNSEIDSSSSDSEDSTADTIYDLQTAFTDTAAPENSDTTGPGSSDTAGPGSSDTADTGSTGNEMMFDPSEIEGLALWMRADRGAMNEFGNPAGDGERVSTWIGQGPNPISARPQSGWSIPTYKENALAGHPVIKFHGNSHLIIGSPLRIGWVYVVANSDGTRSTFPSFAGILGNKNSGVAVHVPVLYGVRFDDYVGNSLDGSVYTNKVLNRTFLPFDEYKLISFEQPESLLLQPPIGLGRADFGVETTSSWNGGIAEVIIYDRALTPSESASIEEYISTRYELIF